MPDGGERLLSVGLAFQRNRYRWPSCTERSGSGAGPAVAFFSPPAGRRKKSNVGARRQLGGHVLWSKTTLVGAFGYRRRQGKRRRRYRAPWTSCLPASIGDHHTAVGVGQAKKRTRGNRVREEGGVKPRPLWPTRRRRGGIGRCTKAGGGASLLRGDRRRASRSGERARSPQRARQHGQLRRRQRRR